LSPGTNDALAMRALMKRSGSDLEKNLVEAKSGLALAAV
jgi:hypothetical protein